MRAAKIVSALLSSAAIAVLSTGCSHTTTATRAHDELIVGEPQEPQSLNPLFLQGAMTELIGPTVFSSLVTADDRGELIPDLATQVPSLQNGGISSDGLTITYHLRNRVKWQDGAPLTASDVVFSYRAILNPKNNVPSRSGYDEVKNVTAVDAHTVRVRLKRRYSPILANFFGPDQNYHVLPSHVLARYADLNHVPFNTAPIGSGPYRVVSWTRGEQLELEANALYFRGEPRIRRIRLRFIPDANTLLEQLRTGEITVLFAADPAYLSQYSSLSAATVTRTPVNSTQGLLFNTADRQMHDVRVRRAIIEAVSIPRLVHDATRGAENPIHAGRGLFSWAYDPSVKLPPYDVADANRLLDAAGWLRGPDGMRARNGTPLSAHFVLLNSDAVSEQVGLMLQQELRPLGITVTLRKFSPIQFAAPAESGGPLFAGNFQIAFVPILTGIDPSNLAFFGCDQIAPRGFNLSRFCDATIEQAYQSDAQTYDPRSRRHYVDIVQQRLAQTLPFVPLWRRRSVSVYPSWLRGIMPSPVSAYWNVAAWRAACPTIGECQ